MSLTIVGDAMARPLADALAHEPATATSPAFSASAPAGRLLAGRAGADQAQLPHVPGDRQLSAPRRRAPAASSAEGGARRFTVSPELERARRRPAAGCRPATIGRLARTRPHPARLLQGRGQDGGHVPIDPDGVRWALPGDFATVDADGTITLLGRGSQCINTGGEKVYPEEVEAALKSHPDVFDARRGRRARRALGRAGRRGRAAARGDARPTLEEISQPLPPDHRRLQGARGP